VFTGEKRFSEIEEMCLDEKYDYFAACND